MQLIFAGISTSFIMINPANVALHYNESYQIVFGTTFRIVFAMVVASLVADLTNCYLFFIFEKQVSLNADAGFARNTMYSFNIDCGNSFFFCLGFYFFLQVIWPSIKMLHLIIDQYAIKVLYENSCFADNLFCRLVH